MRVGTLKILSAVAAAVLDIWVAACCGPLLWQVYGPVPWARMGLLVMAGGLAFTLMDIWSKATIRTSRLLSPTAQELEGADV